MYVCGFFFVITRVHIWHVRTICTHVDAYVYQQEETAYCYTWVKPSKNEEKASWPQSIGMGQKLSEENSTGIIRSPCFRNHDLWIL